MRPSCGASGQHFKLACDFNTPVWTTNKERMEHQMSLYKNRLTFLFMENKLHSVDYYEHAGVPHVDHIYGGFSHHMHAMFSNEFDVFSLHEGMENLRENTVGEVCHGRHASEHVHVGQ